MLPVAFQIVAQAEEGTGSTSSLTALLPILIIGVLFYVLMILPQRRRVKAAEKLRDSVSVGDEIRSVGGIYGTIIELGDDDITIEVAPGSTIRMTRRAIGERLGGAGE
ncbi:MAG: preprotein translocase subunit YajC [Actinobacteria bacterium]|uniref:Protein translocase subunit YajC n=1 Tax=hydrothermal vent metagenome TaxID=652676 RepID=A0A3B0S7P3_9ZZZZ|nr:preprotein translocase subunit YajC [Actinomycetota bacterium]